MPADAVMRYATTTVCVSVTSMPVSAYELVPASIERVSLSDAACTVRVNVPTDAVSVYPAAVDFVTVASMPIRANVPTLAEMVRTNRNDAD